MGSRRDRSYRIRGKMISVKNKFNQSIEVLIRKLKRKVEKEGILKDVKKKKHYLKPSEAKKLKSKLAEKRRKKKANKKS